MNGFEPLLAILPSAQRDLWPELRDVPPEFVLYGGTAVALWCGHRISVDFDFFSNASFSPEQIVTRIPCLAGGTRLQSEPNTLTLLLEQKGGVKVSFFGGLTIGRVGCPATACDIGLAVASRLDLAATKLRVVIERAERKDYLDLAALLKSGIALSEALGGARALYGDRFNPILPLKALSYFEDGDLPQLPPDIKQFLSAEASRVGTVPKVPRTSDRIGH